MRQINLDGLNLPAQWEERAQAARERISAAAARLQAAAPGEKDAITRELKAEIAKHSGLWTEFKAELSRLSDGKCWYCESREHRSDIAVDHFRPKNRVAESTRHGGYWWLALDTRNYRYACDFCNSPHKNPEEEETLGKGTHFPLLDEGRRVFDPDGNLGAEQPLLLDPALAGEPGLLWFREDGSATPRYAEDKYPVFFARADISIKIYNLNDVRVREERGAVAKEIKHQVTRADRYLTQAAKGEEAAYDIYLEAFRRIAQLVCSSASFSSAARAVLAGYRDKDWVETILVTT